MVEPYKPLYTAKQAAQILLINANTVYDLMNTGQLPYLILGSGAGSRKIRGSDLEKFIESYPMEKGGKPNETKRAFEHPQTGNTAGTISEKR